MHLTYRAFGDVRRKGEWIRGDSGRLRSGRREGEDVITAQYTRQSPEHICNYSEVPARWSHRRVEWFLVISRPGRHHQSAFRPEGVTESLDEAERSSPDRPYGTE